MSANTEKCADKDKSVCDYNEFRRLKYFHGMLLDDKDFQAEQQYHAGKRRFLNRMLHGSGVVCGLELKGEKGKRWIQVTPGLALDCSGNEIWVPRDVKIDLASLLPPKNKPKGGDDCEKEDEGDGLKTYYIGIRYDEKPTNPVSVYLPSGSCEERACENSRWKEGYCIEVVECCYPAENPGLLDALCKCDGGTYTGNYVDLCGKCGKDPSKPDNPKGYAAQTDQNADEDYCKCMVVEEFCEQSIPCGECCSCEQPCHVILGQIKINKETCVLETLCMNECRRYVLTGRFVQQLLLRVLGGPSNYLKIKVGNDEIKVPEKVGEFVYNPIKALCWWLTYSLKGKIEWLYCKKTPPPEPTVLLKQLQEESQRQQVVMAQLRTRLEHLEKRQIPESQTAAEKQPSQKVPKKG